MENELHYDFQSYLLSNGNIADKVRLITAGYEVPSDIQESIMKDLSGLQNADGGIPFGFIRGAPSSVKQTSEILTLISKLKAQYKDLVRSMTVFIISRQKNDGGFAESLKLDPYIEDKWGEVGREWYPVGVSITWLTGKALEALCSIEYDDQERLRRARDFLIYSQNEDGHWPDFKDQKYSDPLGTGNILLGLSAMGINSNNKVFEDGRVALLQHMKDSLEGKSIFDVVDLTAIGKPKSEIERNLLVNGLALIIETQNKDGGWIPLGANKSDPELSSKLVFEFKRAKALL
ncbi:MAG: prenyltransferase/squalene oxidase repeat-containing protein [Candidatus Odinarchaeota archaeon]